MVIKKKRVMKKCVPVENERNDGSITVNGDVNAMKWDAPSIKFVHRIADGLAKNARGTRRNAKAIEENARALGKLIDLMKSSNVQVGPLITSAGEIAIRGNLTL